MKRLCPYLHILTHVDTNENVLRKMRTRAPHVKTLSYDEILTLMKAVVDSNLETAYKYVILRDYCFRPCRPNKTFASNLLDDLYQDIHCTLMEERKYREAWGSNVPLQGDKYVSKDWDDILSLIDKKLSSYLKLQSVYTDIAQSVANFVNQYTDYVVAAERIDFTRNFIKQLSSLPEVDFCDRDTAITVVSECITLDFPELAKQVCSDLFRSKFRGISDTDFDIFTFCFEETLMQAQHLHSLGVVAHSNWRRRGYRHWRQTKYVKKQEFCRT